MSPTVGTRRSMRVLLVLERTLGKETLRCRGLRSRAIQEGDESALLLFVSGARYTGGEIYLLSLWSHLTHCRGCCVESLFEVAAHGAHFESPLPLEGSGLRASTELSLEEKSVRMVGCDARPLLEVAITFLNQA